MQSMPEKTVSTKDIYTGKVITVKVSTVEIKDQKYSQREIVSHPGGACVVAINESKKIILVRQFRKPIENYTIELPAGKLESNEDPKNCIKRELHEETEYISHDMKFIQSFYTSPGFSTERIYIYFAKVKEKNEPNPEDDEMIDVLEVSLNEALDMIKRNEISDAKTIIGINWLKDNQNELL